MKKKTAKSEIRNGLFHFTHVHPAHFLKIRWIPLVDIEKDLPLDPRVFSALILPPPRWGREGWGEKFPESGTSQLRSPSPRPSPTKGRGSSRPGNANMSYVEKPNPQFEIQMGRSMLFPAQRPCIRATRLPFRRKENRKNWGARSPLALTREILFPILAR